MALFISKEANLVEAIETQSQEISRIARKVIAGIQANDEEFVKQFANEKLADIHSQINYYQFEKLYLHESNPEYAKSMFSSITRVYKSLKTGLEKRYGSFDSTINVPGLKISIDEIDLLWERINNKFEDSVPDSFDFNVYVGSLDNKWKALGGMVKETDERFAGS